MAILAFFLLINKVEAQRSANWFFGTMGGIRFDASGPVAVTGSPISTLEGCSSMSDVNGKLLFYTDGQTVWNKNHTVMVNGTGLRGGNSSSQSSIVVPDPGSPNRYYIFTATENGNSYRMYCYNIVDMSLQSGLGEIVKKNAEFDNQCSERITAAQHANGTDFWIITNTWQSNTFKAFKLTSTGLSTIPVVSNIGRNVTQIWGMCKVSPDGKWLIQTVANTSGPAITAQLFGFNSSTGAISNPINLNIPSANGSYGCAFSPDNKRIYLSTSFGGTGGVTATALLQYTLTSGVEATINSSRTAIPIPISLSGALGDLSLGPDQRIYIARRNLSRLSSLRNPNDSAGAANFLDTAVVLPIGLSQLGLPNFYNNINIPPEINIKIDTVSCLSFRFTFNSATSYGYQGIFKWDFGDGSPISNDSLALHTYQRTSNDSFLVKFNFQSPDNSVNINFQRWLVLPKKPAATFTAPTQGCVAQSVSIVNSSSSTNGAITQYDWWLGDGTTSNVMAPVKKYADTGSYTIKLLVKDTLGCISDTGRLTIALNKKSIANFELMEPYCKGIPLQVKDSAKVYNSTINHWWYGISNGSQYTSITTGDHAATFAGEGSYTIRAVVNTPEGCISDTVSKTYFVYNTPVASFALPKSCVADISPFVSSSTIAGTSSINYWKWDFGVSNTLADTARTSSTGYQYSVAAQYPVKLLVVTDQGCRDSVTQSFTVNGALPKAKLAFVQNPICARDSVVLVDQSSVDFGSLTSMQIVWGPTSVTSNDPQPNSRYTFKYPEFGTPSSKSQPVRLTVFSGLNCKSQLDTFIVLNAQPKVQFNLLAAICGNAVPFALNQGTETTGALGSFSYSGTGVSSTSAVQYMFNPGSVAPLTAANVQYRFTTLAGCTDSIYQSIQVLAFPTANAGPDMVQLEGEKITLLATATGNALSYAWQPAQFTNNATWLQPMVSANDDTSFLLTVTNALGCMDTSRVQVKVLRSVVPPNAFSPNGDGVNDNWVINNLDRYQNCRVYIFNRDGQEIFKSIGYSRPWNGTWNGKPLPVATYYYIIELGNDRKRLSGWVQLLK